jgi:hypothetical protein
MIITTKKIIDEFTLGYIYAALWELNEGYDIKDISAFYLRDIIDDCKGFQEENFNLLNEFYAFSEKLKQGEERSRILPEHLGHDYWLIRNGFDFDFIKKAPPELVQKFCIIASKRGAQKLIIEGNYLKLLNAA